MKEPSARWNAVLLLASVVPGILVLEGAARYLKIAPAVLRINPGSQQSAFRFSGNPVPGYEMPTGVAWAEHSRRAARLP